MARPPGHGAGYEPRREEIIDRAAVLFAEKGYAATGVNEICEAVGLGKGALYYYIGSNHTYQWAHTANRYWTVRQLSGEYCRTLFQGMAKNAAELDGLEDEADRLREMLVSTAVSA